MIVVQKSYGGDEVLVEQAASNEKRGRMEVKGARPARMKTEGGGEVQGL